MGFGLSRELAEKNAAKYSAEDEVRSLDKIFFSIFSFHILKFTWIKFVYKI